MGRFYCSATHAGEWRGHAPTGRRFENVEEVYFFRFAGGRFVEAWGSRTPSTASGSSACRPASRRAYGPYSGLVVIAHTATR